MSKFLINETLIDSYLQIFNIWHSKIWNGGEEIGLCSSLFHLLLDSDEMLTEQKSLAVYQTGDRCCQEWRGWSGKGKAEFSLCPRKYQTSTFPGLLPEQAQVRLCVRPVPHRPLPPPAPACSAKSTHNLLVEWQSKETVRQQTMS